MPVSYLDLLNDARGRQGSTPLTTVGVVASTGDALKGVQAVNEVVNHLIGSSVDLDFNDNRQDVVLTAGNQTVTSPAAPNDWNSQLIKNMWVITSGNLIPLALITPEKATELEYYLTTAQQPLFYYVAQDVVKVIPAPDQAYTLRIIYQNKLKRITSSNIGDTVPFTEDFYKIFTDGVYAQLRKGQADPEWSTLWNEYIRQLNKGYMRNKWNQKWAGKRLFRMKPSRDRTW